MEKTGNLSSFIEAAKRYSEPSKRLAREAWRILSFNLASDRIAPAAAVSVSVERGRIVITAAKRSFSRYSISGHRVVQTGSGRYPSAEEAASFAAVAMNDMGIRSDRLILTLPKAWIMLKNADLPAATSENLQQVISFEFDRFTPLNADEACYDYSVCGQTEDKISAVIAAAKDSVVNEYRNAFREKGFEVERVRFDLSSVATVCRFLTGLDTFLLAIPDEEGFQIGSVRNGILCGAAADRYGESTAERAMAITVAAGRLAAATGNNAVDSLILLPRPGSEELSAFPGEFRVMLPPALSSKVQAGDGIAMHDMAAFGAVLEDLWPQAHGSDLMSRGARPSVKVPLLATIFLGVLILAAFVVYLAAPLSIEEEKLREIDRQIGLRKAEVLAVEKIKKEIEDLKKEMALVNSFKNERTPAVGLMRELTAIIPKTSWLTRVRIAGSQINLEGYSPAAASLIQLLEGSKYFQKVEFSSPTFRDARLSMDRFQIKMELEIPGQEAEGDEKK